MKLTRILAPTDLSRYSGFAMEWAAYLAQCLQAELVLLHVLTDEEGKIMEEVIGEGAVVQVPNVHANGRADGDLRPVSDVAVARRSTERLGVRQRFAQRLHEDYAPCPTEVPVRGRPHHICL